MRRRDVIALLGGAAAWPLGAVAQQPERIRRVAVLMLYPADDPPGVARSVALRDGLAELGWREGRNLHLDWRWAAGDVERVREYAAELVELAPDLIVANGSPSVRALQKATR